MLPAEEQRPPIKEESYLFGLNEAEKPIVDYLRDDRCDECIWENEKAYKYQTWDFDGKKPWDIRFLKDKKWRFLEVENKFNTKFPNGMYVSDYIEMEGIKFLANKINRAIDRGQGDMCYGIFFEGVLYFQTCKWLKENMHMEDVRDSVRKKKELFYFVWKHQEGLCKWEIRR